MTAYDYFDKAEDVQRAFAEGRTVEVRSPGFDEWWPAGPFIDDLLRSELANGVQYRAPKPAEPAEGREYEIALRKIGEEMDVRHYVAAQGGAVAILDEVTDWLYRSSESRGDDNRAAAVMHVRADIAELIGAAAALPRDGSVDDAAWDRLDMALARIGEKP